MKTLNLAVLLIFAAPFSFAEPVDTQTQTQELERKKKIQAQVEKTAAQAEKTALPPGGGEVTYEDLLAHPDDVDLNYRYARAQVEKGNLRGAAATLERILMVDPNLPRVRLFYAIVLYRLDNIDDSERELATLKSQKMPDSLRAEVDEYVAEIHKRRRSTHFSALVGAGLDYDDNRNAAPATGQRLFFDTPIILDGNSTRKGDVSKTMLASVGATHDLGFQAGHQLFAGMNYYRAEQTNVRILNLQAYGANLGGTFKSRWADVTPEFAFGHLLLAEHTYLRTYGESLRFDRKIGGRLAVYGKTGYTRVGYNATPIVPTGPQRTGDVIDGEVGAAAALCPRFSLSGSYNHSNVGALERFDAFRREALSLTPTLLLGRGQFIFAAMTLNFDQYEQPEAAISASIRKDTMFRGRLTYGVPMGFIAAPLKNLLGTLSYEYFTSHSNIMNYSYTNNKVSTLFTYKWEL